MTAERYLHVKSRKREGAHYTPDLISDFISQKILENAEITNTTRIVDPAVGDGELLISLIGALKQKGIKNIEVYGFDTNEHSIQIAQKRLNEIHPDIEPYLHHKNFLDVCIERDSLITQQQTRTLSNPVPDFDLLIANPPYIRTQVLGAVQSKMLSETFGLNGRIDIYQAFLVAMKSLMKPDGVAGVIVSNRFMTTEGAGRFRETLLKLYSIKGIWDFGDTKVFEAAVLPAVMVLSSEKSNDNINIPFSSVYIHPPTTSLSSPEIPHVANQIDALSYTGIVRNSVSGYLVKHGHLTYDSSPSDVWRLQDEKSESWLRKVDAKTWCKFRDVGKVRVGVKTTADKVFIRDDWEKDIGYIPELVRPLLTHHIAGRFKSQEKSKKSILYTHTSINGKRVTYNLDDYPKSKMYLEANRDKLANRDYILKSKRKWFEIWVPQNPDFWILPKIVFRDITEQPTFWLDMDGSVVNGDCYWMISDNDHLPKDILWLVLAVANSEFIEEFYDLKFQNKLYSNKRRFITQYVEKFPVPDPYSNKSKELIELAKNRYQETVLEKQIALETRIDHLVWSIFDVPHIDKI